MNKTAKSSDRQRRSIDVFGDRADPADPIEAVAEVIRADARRAPKTYARDSEVPGGGE
jgi:hypothetical protein